MTVNTVGRWGTYESDMLKAGHTKFGGEWSQISKWLASNHKVYRASTQCRHRYQKTMRPDLKKGHWSKEEDDKLVAAVVLQQHGGTVSLNWRVVADAVTCRTGKACRERWVSHLCPEIDHSPLTEEEGKLILHLQETDCHNQWSKIAVRLGRGRTAEAVKSRWKTLTGYKWQGSRKQKRPAPSEFKVECKKRKCSFSFTTALCIAPIAAKMEENPTQDVLKLLDSFDSEIDSLPMMDFIDFESDVQHGTDTGGLGLGLLENDSHLKWLFDDANF